LTIGVYSFEIHLPASRSLKDRRRVTRRLKERLRSRLNVAVAELEHLNDLWQRAGFVVVSVAGRREPLERLFETVHREIVTLVPGEVIETGRDFIEGADGGDAGWDEEWA